MVRDARPHRTLEEKVVRDNIFEWRRKRLGDMIQDRTRDYGRRGFFFGPRRHLVCSMGN